MLMVALVLAVIGLAALVTAVVTSNEIVAWVCIAASSVGVILLVVDAVRERQARRAAGPALADAEAAEASEATEVIESVEAVETEATEVIESDGGVEEEIDIDEEIAVEDHPEEVVHDEPEFDTYSDDEQEFPESAEEAALHTVDEDEMSDDVANDAADDISPTDGPTDPEKR